MYFAKIFVPCIRIWPSTVPTAIVLTNDEGEKDRHKRIITCGERKNENGKSEKKNSVNWSMKMLNRND